MSFSHLSVINKTNQLYNVVIHFNKQIVNSTFFSIIINHVIDAALNV